MNFARALLMKYDFLCLNGSDHNFGGFHTAACWVILVTLTTQKNGGYDGLYATEQSTGTTCNNEYFFYFRKKICTLLY